MTTEDAFLRAILENRDDDTPRLIYADWLEERGDPRAEFIRVQCELAALESTGQGRPDLELREHLLLKRHQDEWLGPLKQLLHNWTFRRGFLHSVYLPATVYLKQGTLPWSSFVRRVVVDLKGLEVSVDTVQNLPESMARENGLVPIGFRNQRLVLATSAILDETVFSKIDFILNRPIEIVIAAESQIREIMEGHYPEPVSMTPLQAEMLNVELTGGFTDPRISPQEWEDYFSNLPPLPIEFERNVQLGDSRVCRLVAGMIVEAVDQNASQIRIEVRADDMQLFFQQADVLVPRETMPYYYIQSFVSELRRMARLEAVVGRVEQSGHIRIDVRDKPFDITVLIRSTNDGPSMLLTMSPLRIEGIN